jgi:hypothetical protein
MTDIVATAAQISPVFPNDAEIITGIATEAVTAGQPAYQTTVGKFGIADANASGKQQARGIFLQTVAAGQAVDILKRGHCYGFTLSSQNYDAPLYLSDTAGSIADSVGTMTVCVGRVMALPDSSLTKVAYIDCPIHHVWA